MSELRLEDFPLAPIRESKRIAVIGAGYVGLVTGAALAHGGHRVTCIDNDPTKLAKLQAGEIPIYEPGLDQLVAVNRDAGRLAFSGEIASAVAEADVVYICVGTPPLPSGKADLSYIEQVSNEIAAALAHYTVIVEKSTVPVHTGVRVKATIERLAPPTARFDVVSNPEFLAEGSAVRDALRPSRIVIGVDSEHAERVMRAVYQPFVEAEPPAALIATGIESAEIIKHASNSFLALKISYINAVSRVCELAGADVAQVALGMGLDERIGPRFLRAGIGYGGSCFPKDVDAFHDIARELGYEFTLIKEAQRINTEQRQLYIKKIEDALWVVRDKRVAVLGLSFKPDTDDLREAPAMDVITWLLQHNAQVAVHDPAAMGKARELLPTNVEFCDDAYAAAEGAEALLLLTEWRDYHPETLDMARVKASMKRPLLLDARNLYAPAAMAELGFEYVSMGRASIKQPGQVRGAV